MSAVSVTEVRNALRCPRIFALGRARPHKTVAFPVGASSLGATFHRIAERFARDLDAPPEAVRSLRTGAPREEVAAAFGGWLLGHLVDALDESPALASMPGEVDDLGRGPPRARALPRRGDRSRRSRRCRPLRGAARAREARRAGRRGRARDARGRPGPDRGARRRGAQPRPAWRSRAARRGARRRGVQAHRRGQPGARSGAGGALPAHAPRLPRRRRGAGHPPLQPRSRRDPALACGG